MRILLITDNHTPTGGAENYFFELKKQLASVPGNEIFSLGFGPQVTQGSDHYVLKSTTSNFTKLIWQLLFHPLVYFKLRAQIKKIQPDIIHLHNVKQYTCSVLRAVRSYPVVQTIHDYGMVCPVAYNIHKNYEPCATGWRLRCFWQHQVKFNRVVYLAVTYAFFMIRKKLQTTATHFFAPSPQLVGYLKQNGFTNASWAPPFKQERDACSFAKIKPTHFLFAGNIGAHKGIYVLLDEFALAVKKNPRLTLTIAGTGNEEQHLRKKTAALGLTQQVSFIGWQSNMREYYEECAAVIFPSLWLEAFGLVMTEAMSHGRPLIGSNRGSPVWLIDDNKTGLIFDPCKSGELAEKILKLADNIELVKEMGTNGFQKWQTLPDNQEALASITEVYERVVGSGGQ